MASRTIEIPAPPGAVWDVIADPRTYPDWLAGCRAIRAVDDDWPEIGSAFHHHLWVGPLPVDDATSVLELRQPERLVLYAGVGPGGRNRVVFTLAPTDEGTALTMQEYAARGPLVSVAAPLLDLLMRIRNELSLRRLRRLLHP